METRVQNKIGIYYAYWTRDWAADFVPYLRRARDLGFDVLEVNAGTIVAMDRTARARLREASEETGVPMSCCIGLPPRFDIADERAEVRRAGIDYLGRIAAAMCDCGIRKLTGIIYSSWPGSPDERNVTRDLAWRWSVESMREAIRTAEDFGLEYHVEVVNRFEQFLINTAEDAMAYVTEVASPNLRILLDTYHMNIEEDSMAGAIACAGPFLGHLHVGETNRKPPGRGRIPWDEVSAALRSIHYAGWIVMEPFLRRGGEVGRDIRVHRDLMPGADLDEEARRACAFMRRLVAQAGRRKKSACRGGRRLLSSPG